MNIDDELAALPSHEAPTADRARRAAQAALRHEVELARSPRWFALVRLYSRVLEPVGAAGVVALYLAWLVARLLALHAAS